MSHRDVVERVPEASTSPGNSTCEIAAMADPGGAISTPVQYHLEVGPYATAGKHTRLNFGTAV